jgi:hypothetical protein
MAADGFASFISQDPQKAAEGIVMRPAVELVAGNGERVIAKVKHKDFHR